jgi:hypothetical protein
MPPRGAHLPVLSILMCSHNEVARIERALEDVIQSLKGRTDVEPLQLEST